MRIVATSLLVLLLLSSSAVAGMSGSIEDACAVFRDRVDTIVSASAPTAEEKRERRRLSRALSRLQRYSGSGEASDLKCCCQAVALAMRSRSPDVRIFTVLDQMRDALVAYTQGRRAAAFVLHQTVSEEEWPRVMARIRQGDRICAAAWSVWPGKPERLFKLLRRAAGRFDRAVALARAHETSPGDVSGDVYLLGARLCNRQEYAVEIHEITYELTGLLGGLAYSDQGQVSEDGLEAVPITVAAATDFDLLPLITALVSVHAECPRWMPGDMLTVRFTLHTTAGDIASP